MLLLLEECTFLNMEIKSRSNQINQYSLSPFYVQGTVKDQQTHKVPALSRQFMV